MSLEALKEMLDRLHEETAVELLRRVTSGQATSADLAAAIKFLKDNNATLDIVTPESPTGNLLDKLPFDIT